MNWICCQIGAREHYAVARALHRNGSLELLLTDIWCRPGNPLAIASHRLRERFHGELASTKVRASNAEAIGVEMKAKALGLSGWSRIIARNVWFQRMAVRRLSRMRLPGTPRAVFAFSYAAREVFRLAHARGWRTVLGQIDAGPQEEDLVARLHAEAGAPSGRWDRPTVRYWSDWREECALAERIIVNSSWSQAALEREGVPAAKIRVVPLAYEEEKVSKIVPRVYPDEFTPARPLRVLFLGSVCLRKGVGPLLDAIRLLRGQAVEFWFVGELQMPIPTDLRANRQVRWVGQVARNETGKFYRDADVFIFPTFSDGFGLTQLEAQAFALPVIASRNCGNVVKHGRNGMLLSEITSEEIGMRIGEMLADPSMLNRMSMNAIEDVSAYNLDRQARLLEASLA
jgi:glycosyltransferase involved in cell wall biosynthesis